MNVKFIVDKFKEQDRKQLELIKRVIKEGPSHSDENSLFLRKFTLAILQQYNKGIKVNNKNIHSLPEVPHKIELNFNVPKAPRPLNLDFKLEAPKKLEL